LRHGRFEGTQTIGAVVTTGGNVAAGTEIGFMLIYRNAQTDE
jgi:ABC-type sulfate transport system permease component